MLKLGEKIIKSLYLGDKAIAKVFWGAKLIYEKISAQPIFFDYISFDGNSWIDVDYAPTSNTRVVGKFSITAFKGSGANYVFGVYGDSANYGLNIGSNRKILNIPWASAAAVAMDNPNNFNQVYSFDISKNGAYLDGVLKLTASQLSATFTATKSFFVGWSNGTSTEKFIGNVYPMQMYENDVLVKDLRPCLDPKGTVCLYDMVTNQYHYNIGTGTIKAGNVIPDVAHTEIEYLEGDSVSYINTGVTAENGLSIELKIYVPSISGVCYPLGAYNGTQRFYPMYFNGGRICNRFGTGAATQSAEGALTTGWHHYLIKTSKTKNVDAGNGSTYYSCVWEYVDGVPVLKTGQNMYTGTTGKDLYIFANNGNGSVTVGNSSYTDSTGYLRMALCKITANNGVLIRDYIPVEKSDGVKCLYDKVEKKYYEFQTA